MKIVFIGLSITSSWGNGHATTYRALIRALAGQGCNVTFLEWDAPYYAANRDLPNPSFCNAELYGSFDELTTQYRDEVRDADAVIVGSYVPQGVAVGEWVMETASGIVAFYDIDTPVTLNKLKKKDYEYLRPDLIPGYDLYLSFTGGPTLQLLQDVYGSPAARDLYCSVDPALYYPETTEKKWDLGYLGTYSPDRQPAVEELMLRAARNYRQGRFIVAGPQYPENIRWPENVTRIDHLPPSTHRAFYNAQRFTLNITRADMIDAGYSPSVRLFEAAACGLPIISDYWQGLESVFEPGKEILIAHSADETLSYIRGLTEDERREVGEMARKKTLKYHTSASRASQLLGYIAEIKRGKRLSTAGAPIKTEKEKQ